jgi:type VI secretion system protein VasJ
VELSSIEGLGKNPIPGDSPAGRDVRLEDDFFQLQAEIDRLNSLSLVEEGGIKWPVVASIAGKILKEESKDILVAAYLAVSELELEGVPSLAPSARVLNDLISTFWDTMFPPLKRLRARVNAIDWWRERTAAWLKKYEGGEVAPEERDLAQEELTALDKTLLEKELPRVIDLIKALSAIPTKAKAAAAPAPEAAAPAPQAAEPPAAPAAPQEAAPAPAQAPVRAPAQPAAQAAQVAAAPNLSPEDEPQALSALGQAADNYLAYLPKAYDNPRYWSLSRLRLWLPVKALPPSEGGRTRILPPDGAFLPAIRALLEKGAYADAVSEVEGALGGALFWLEPHFLAWKGLQGLGFEASSQALRWACQTFVARIPGVLGLGFDDGTPFASSETVSWLEDTGGGTRVPSARKAGPDYEAIAQGEPEAAIGRLGLPENLPRDGRDRVGRAICQALLWQRLGRPLTAASAARELETLIERHGLLEFDPGLAAKALKAVYNVYRNLGPAFSPKAREALDRLAGIRPEEALLLPAPDDE